MSSHRKFQENWEYISVEDWGGKYGKDPVSINRRFDNIWLFIKNDQEFCIKVLLKQRNDVCHVRCGLIMKRVEKWKKVINQVTARPHYEKSAIPNHFWWWIIVDKIQRGYSNSPPHLISFDDLILGSQYQTETGFVLERCKFLYSQGFLSEIN